MYGQVAGATTGAGTVAAGVALLPNTGDNLPLTILSVATIIAGALVVISFVATRLIARLHN